MHLYETHLPVTHTELARKFYAEIVGLPFAYRDPTRDIVFLWATTKEQGMVGLWGPNTAYGSENGIERKCHLAFTVALDELFAAIAKLNKKGMRRLISAAARRANQASLVGCHLRRFISAIRMAIRWSLSAFCQVHRIQVSTGRTQNGKN